MLSCIYLSLYLYVHIIIVCQCNCACFSRWVLDHLLGFVWEVPKGRNLIPPRHLGIFTILAFNLCHPFYFPSKPRSPFNLCHPFYFPSNPFPFLIYVIHFIHICIYVCLCVCVQMYIYIHIYMYILKTHLVYKTLVNVQTPKYKFSIQAYIQTIYMRNMKYKQYSNY